jgi:hypothetical protein
MSRRVSKINVVQDNGMGKALSTQDLQKFVPFKLPIYRYTDIAQYAMDPNRTIDDMMGPNKCAIILFETRHPNGEQSVGHWTCVLRTHDDDNNPSINFFDSYGFVPDDEKKLINKEFMNMVGMSKNFLTQLLDEAHRYDNVIEYNEVPFQDFAPDIATCGRHCMLRIIMKDLSMAEYQKLMNDLKSKYKRTPDEIVTILTDPVLNGEMSNDELRTILSELELAK